MPYFDLPPGKRVRREFRIFRSPDGRWVAAEAQGLPGGMFRTRDEAVRFALWQADQDAGRVHIVSVSSLGAASALRWTLEAAD